MLIKKKTNHEKHKKYKNKRNFHWFSFFFLLFEFVIKKKGLSLS